MYIYMFINIDNQSSNPFKWYWTFGPQGTSICFHIKIWTALIEVWNDCIILSAYVIYWHFYLSYLISLTSMHSVCHLEYSWYLNDLDCLYRYIQFTLVLYHLMHLNINISSELEWLSWSYDEINTTFCCIKVYFA